MRHAKVYWPELMIELYVDVKNATIKETLCKKWWASEQRQIMKDYESRFTAAMLRLLSQHSHGSLGTGKAFHLLGIWSKNAHIQAVP